MLHRYRPLTPLMLQNKVVKKRSSEPEMESRCNSSESDDLEDIYQERPNFENYEYPNDFWKFVKSIKYLSYGRPLITTAVLIILCDCNFQDPIMLKSLNDYKIITILLNFLQSKDKRLQTISLRFLKKLSKIRALRKEIVYLGGVSSMVFLLKEPEMDVRQAAAETITCVADFHKAWKAVRLAGGIPLLVNMIYVSQILLFEDPETLSEQLVSVLRAAEVAAETLHVVCKCSKNQTEFLLSGALKGCQNILKTPHVRLCTFILQIIQMCASQNVIRLAIQNSNILESFRAHFYSNDQRLVQAAAQAAFMCATGEQAKQFFGKVGFVDKLYEIIQTSAFHTDFELMASISGALWKSAENEKNVNRIQALNAAPLLIQLLSSQPKKVQEYLVACISCCLSNPQIRTTIRKNNGIEALIGLLHTTHPPLIMHLNKALATSSTDNECLMIIEKQDALRLMWSHLKHECFSVQANAAWQLSSILKNIEHSARYVRSLVGGIQVLMECLTTEHTRVSTSVCALIVVLCKETDNLKILTNYQVVEHLSRLTGTRCRRLRYHLCMAITACCPFKNNREEFAKRRIVYPIIGMLKSKSSIVKGAATHALYQLAHIPKWCAVMYNTPGVYEVLLKEMRSTDENVQECAAGIIQKMRLFALNRDGNVPMWLVEKHTSFT
ncbi:armadillo repeat-containing protein 4 [Trichonephila inaurata madagascariensis]|uniref:Armadillo repeat-containing protein 4 n=1 Tax=Trichonephila inaurata madagascariensis TaxID=2747483 RepID=A0A8X6YSP5_9ARAC|nr:armadillo repeat-containing protein 4 [Trichonephila inaurata madagascariensis]